MALIDLRPEFLPRLLAARPMGQLAGIAPQFGGLGLTALPGSIARWLGAPALTPTLDAAILTALPERVQHVVLVVVDGLGLRQLEAAAAVRPEATRLLQDALLAPLTSIAPSTTAAALTSLWTGLPPAGHAITGYEIWLQEYSLIMNAITHAPVTFQGDPGGLRRAGFDSRAFLSVPTLGAHLAGQAVDVFAYHPVALYRSSLSTMLMGGAKSIPYRTQNDLWISLAAMLRAGGVAQRRTYHYVYWGDLDELMHHYGPDDERIALELEDFLRGFNRFIERLRPPTDDQEVSRGVRESLDRNPAQTRPSTSSGNDYSTGSGSNLRPPTDCKEVSRGVREAFDSGPDLTRPASQASGSTGSGSILLLLTADHGQISTPRDERFDLKNHPELRECLVMNPSGESRLPYLYLRPGREERLRRYLEDHFPGLFPLMPSEEVLRSGLLGENPSAQAIQRTGDLIAFPQGSSYLWWANKENTLLGRHGGLTEQEMLVPLIGIVIS